MNRVELIEVLEKLDSMPKEMSKSEAAKHLHCDRRKITRLIEAGAIKIQSTGRISRIEILKLSY